MGMFVLLHLTVGPLSAADLTSTYTWKPINIGAGGWADGIIISDTDPNVRFMRDDTGQYYRWSVADNKWLPMVVQNDDGSGFGESIIPRPSHGISVLGNDGGSFALDPNDNKSVYLYLAFGTPDRYGSLPWNVYKSIDGGKNFVATRFNDAAKFTLKSNDTFLASFRTDGECLTVDPNNSKVVYIGTGTRGIFRSTDGGDTWKAMSGGGLPAPAGVNGINILPYRKGGAVTVNGVSASKVIYLIYGNGPTVAKLPPKNDTSNPNAKDGVFKSTDGGQTWIQLKADGNGLTDRCRCGVLDQNTGALYVQTNRRGGPRVVWKYDGSVLTKIYNADAAALAVDPKNPNNLMSGGGLAWGISTDAGKTWKNIPRPYICSGKHPQGFSGNDPHRSCMFACMRMDSAGNVWFIEGNDGVLRWKFDPSATEIDFVPDTAGVENFCSMDIAFLKNRGGKAIVSVMDNNAMLINNLDTFDVTLFCENGLNNGENISVCPNDPDTFSIVSYASRITTDGGKTFQVFTMRSKKVPEGPYTVPEGLIFGSLQISRRGNWKAGEDHLVWLNGKIAVYSKDGGKTWTPTTTDFGKSFLSVSPWSVNRNLVADPFIPDKFYMYFHDGSFWITTDGGATWAKGATPAGNPGCYQLTGNDAAPNDLWASTKGGIYHSPDAGATWNLVTGNDNLRLDHCLLALGKGSGKPGDAPYTVYYFYGTLDWGKPARDYGVYRSTNAGASWDRIARWPAGLMAINLGWGLSCMSASWDTFGLVGIAVNGQGFVYGKPK